MRDLHKAAILRSALLWSRINVVPPKDSCLLHECDINLGKCTIERTVGETQDVVWNKSFTFHELNDRIELRTTNEKAKQ